MIRHAVKPCASTPATAASPTARPTGKTLAGSRPPPVTCACLKANGISLSRHLPKHGNPPPLIGSRHARTPNRRRRRGADDFFAPPPPCPTRRRHMPPSGNCSTVILRDTVDTWARVHTLGGLSGRAFRACADTLLVYGSGNERGRRGPRQGRHLVAFSPSMRNACSASCSSRHARPQGQRAMARTRRLPCASDAGHADWELVACRARPLRRPTP